MKLAALVSGGKDSIYALFKMIKAGHDVKYLITFRPKNTASYMFHHPCIELTSLQAEALGINQIIVDTAGEKEKELEDLERILRKIKGNIDGVVSGALASNYQKTRIDSICKKLGLQSIAPLWKLDTEQYWKNLLKNKFVVMVTSVASEGLDEEWLGRIMNNDAVEELKLLRSRFGLHLGFEGGEAESFVLDCPLFKKQIKIIDFKKNWDSKVSSGYLDIKKARLISK